MGSNEFQWYYDHQPRPDYWYFTTHGVMPGSWPKGANVLDIIDTPNGSYVHTDKLLKTEALKKFDLKERWPSDALLAQYERGNTIKAHTSVRSSRIVAASDIQNIKSDVATTLDAIFREAIDNAMDNLAHEMAYQVKSYNADWCEQDGYASCMTRLEYAVDNAVMGLTNACIKVLFKNVQ